MEVKVLSYTSNPEVTCAAAMRATQSTRTAYEWSLDIIPKCRAEELGEYECCRAKALSKNLAWTAGWFQCRYDKNCAERMLIEAKNRKHWGVFEHATYTVDVSGVSRALTHQLVRHRQDSFLQQSQRHVDPTKIPDWYNIPKSISSHGQSAKCEALYVSLMKDIENAYGELVRNGVPEEDARFVLPNACKTNIVITANARQWFHIFYMRLSEAAQWEIREMAQEILKEFMKISPIIFEGAGKLEV